MFLLSSNFNVLVDISSIFQSDFHTNAHRLSFIHAWLEVTGKEAEKPQIFPHYSFS
jgi:hypothetical protein